MFAANRHRLGLTLAEVLVSIVIAALGLVAVLSIYDQFQRSASAIIARIERPQLLTEILQRIAEDVDRLVDSEHEVRVTVDNRFDNGYPIARLVLEKSYSDRAPEDPPLEEIVWQGHVDIGTDRIVLYRKHSGLMLEDKLLDAKRKPVEESYPYIPLAGGLTAFRIRARQGINWLDRWQGKTRPTGIEVMLAVAEPQKTPGGNWEVAEKDQFVRTIAMDRTRIIPFAVEGVPAGSQESEEKQGQLGQMSQTGPRGQLGLSGKPTAPSRSANPPRSGRQGGSQRSGVPRRVR